MVLVAVDVAPFSSTPLSESMRLSSLTLRREGEVNGSVANGARSAFFWWFFFH